MGGVVHATPTPANGKFPISLRPIRPPRYPFANKHKPLEKVLRLVSVNRDKIAIRVFPLHCFNDECLEAIS